MNKKLLLTVSLMMMPLAGYAGEENKDVEPLVTATKALHSDALHVDPMSSSYLLQLVAGLVVVLICIIALAWLTKKVNRFRFISDDSLKLIGGLSVGAREKIVLMQVGEKQLLLGVSPGRINTLHVLDTPLATAENGTGESVTESFASKLKTTMEHLNRKNINKEHDRQQGEQ